MEPERQTSVAPGQPAHNPQPGWSQLAAGTSLLVGGLITIMGLGHLYGVLVTATNKGYAYDFRLAALVLVGIALIFGGVLCLSAVSGLSVGRRTAWWRAVIGTVLLLLVLVPLIPMQPDMNPGLSFLAAVNVVALLGARRGLGAG
jgi:hypothetical protein